MFSGCIASNTGLKRVKAQSQWVKLWGTFICKQWGAPCPGLFIFTRWYLCKCNPLNDNRRIVCVGLTIFWGLALKKMIFVMIMLWNNMLQPTPFLCFKVECQWSIMLIWTKFWKRLMKNSTYFGSHCVFITWPLLLETIFIGTQDLLRNPSSYGDAGIGLRIGWGRENLESWILPTSSFRYIMP